MIGLLVILNLPRASLIAQLVKKLPAMRSPQFNSWVRKIHWRKDRVTPVFVGFPGASAGKESASNVGDITGLGRSPGEGKGYPLQYSGLENGLYSPRGHKESDTTEQLSLFFNTSFKRQFVEYFIIETKSIKYCKLRNFGNI